MGLKQYTDEAVWDIETDDSILDNVGAVWRATNDAVAHRSIGPAIIEDILRYITNHQRDDVTGRLTEAVISYIFPQLEGVPERKDIVRNIYQQTNVDEPKLKQAAVDMLDIRSFDSETGVN